MCSNKIVEWIGGWNGREVEVNCGSFMTNGIVLCQDCLDKATKQYPQGWRRRPGDICQHGNYVGDPGGVDCLCPQCESRD